jgi:hypothetical protein
MSRADPGSNRRVATIVAAVLVLGLLLVWLRARRQDDAALAHERAVEQADVAPGTPVTDPLLPAGHLVIDLVPAAPGLHLLRPATIHVGAKVGEWTASSAVELDDQGLDRRYAISVAGPYLVETGMFDAPAGAHGQRLSLRAIPIDPAIPYVDGREVERVMEVDLTRADVIGLRRIEGMTVLETRDLPRSPAVLGGTALAERFTMEYKMHKDHWNSLDRRRNLAIVRAAPTASFAEVFPVVDAILTPKRPMTTPAGDIDISAFDLSVQGPLPARVRGEHRVIDEGEPAWKGPLPAVRAGAIAVAGRLDSEGIKRVLAANEGALRGCYVEGLRRQPKLHGSLTVLFTIGQDKAVSRVARGDSDLPDPATIECMLHTFDDLVFSKPEGGTVRVTIPYLLSPAR